VRLAALVVLAALPARAYRPFDGTDASVAKHGDLEIELGPVGYLRQGNERFLVAPAVIVNLGVLERRRSGCCCRPRRGSLGRTFGLPLFR
jgi:hypothetical protein